MALGFRVLLLASFVVADGGEVSKEERIRGALFGALVADALCLGSHYEYDAPKIKKAYGGKPIDKFMGPGDHMGGMTHGVGWGQRNYHPGKRVGENTDYGDYNILILEYLANQKGAGGRMELKTLIPHWQKRMKNWKAWMCTQTKQTLQQVQSGVPHKQLGGMSNAMAIRHAAAYGAFHKEDDVVHAAATSMFTHREPTAQEGGKFFAQVTFRIIHGGLRPREAIEEVAKESSSFIKKKVKQAIDKVAEATDPTQALSKEEFVDDLALTSMARLWEVGKSEPIKVGKASPTEGTLPGAIYFILKYDNLEQASAANAMVGGDNASRAIPVGMVLGAAKGVSAIPAKLKETYKEWAYVEKLMSKLPLLSKKSEL